MSEEKKQEERTIKLERWEEQALSTLICALTIKAYLEDPQKDVPGKYKYNPIKEKIYPRYALEPDYVISEMKRQANAIVSIDQLTDLVKASFFSFSYGINTEGEKEKLEYVAASGPMVFATLGI